MRKLLAIAVLGASFASFQTVAIAQPANGPGTVPYCEAQWSSMVSADATKGESHNAFMDRCTSCDAKWDAMVAANATDGMSRDAYMRKCGKVAWLGGYSAIPELAVVGGGAILGIALSGSNDKPVSP